MLPGSVTAKCMQQLRLTYTLKKPRRILIETKVISKYHMVLITTTTEGIQSNAKEM